MLQASVIYESRPPLVQKSSFVPRHASNSYAKEQFFPSLSRLTDQLYSLPGERELCAPIQKVISPPIQFASRYPGLISHVLSNEMRKQDKLRSRSSMSYGTSTHSSQEAGIRSVSSLSTVSKSDSMYLDPDSSLNTIFSQPSFAFTHSTTRSSQLRRQRRLPNVQQLPRWERGEDASWNPPTYVQQSRPGSQSHILLESLPIRPRTLQQTRSRWRTSAVPLVAMALC
jgi:hypothetical protein